MGFENYYACDTTSLKKKKITGHSFVGLLGVDPFKTIGDTLLTMYKIVEEKVDEKYLRRGDWAEAIVKKVYERDGFTCVTYDKEKINYDNFKDNEDFGGLIDIDLPNERTLIEVKSKSMKDYDKILFNQPKQEVYQGIYYGHLKNYDKVILEWVFFDEQTEKEIFEGKKPTSLKGLKKISKTYKVNHEQMEEALNRTRAINDNFYRTGLISYDAISDKNLKALGITREKCPVDVEDLPF